VEWKAGNFTQYCLRPSGDCILTIRPNNQEARRKGILKPFGVREEGSKRQLIFQVWDFKGGQYDSAMYFVVEDQRSGAVAAHVMRSRYYAIRHRSSCGINEAGGF